MHPVLNLGFTPESTALFAQMTTKPSSTRMRQIDNVIRQLIVQSIWSKLGVFYMLAAHNAQAAGLNWVSPAGTALTAVNSPTFAVDGGYTGDGSTSYLDTGIANSSVSGFSQNTAHFGGWNLTAGTSGRQMMGHAASGNLAMSPNTGGNSRVIRLNSATGITTNDGLAIGHSVGVRRDSANVYSYRNGADEQTAATTSAAIAAGNIVLLQRNAVNFFNGQLAVAHAGDQLSAGEVMGLYTSIRNYLHAVGAV